MYQSKRLILRPFREEDAQHVMEMRSDFRDVQSYVGRPFPNDEAGEKEWIASMYHKGPLTNIHLVVEEKETNSFVGFVVASNISYTHRNAHVGVFFHKKARGKGYYKEAQIVFYAYLFREINLHKVTSGIIPYNEIAVKITAAIGFQTDGVRREQFYQNGKYYDEILISLLARDFFEQNKVDEVIL